MAERLPVMNGDCQGCAPDNIAGFGLEQLDFVTLLNCVRDAHMRETSALRAELSRMTTLKSQEAPATAVTENLAENSMRLAEASRIEGGMGNSSYASQEQDEMATKSSQSTSSKRVSLAHAQDEELRISFKPADSETRETQKDAFSMPSDIAKRRSVLNTGISDLFEYGQKGQRKPKALTERLITSPHFDITVSIIIGINILVIALEAEYRGLCLESDLKTSIMGILSQRPEWPGAEQVFDALEWLFGIVFWVELFIRAYCERLKMFRQYYTWIDVIVAVLWTISKIGLLGNMNPRMLRILRVMRAVRLVKLLRFIETFDPLHLMITACSSSMMALIWFTCTMTLVLTFCALVITEGLHVYYFESRSMSSDSFEGNTWNMFLCFGTFSRSLFSMYELALANWPPLGRLLSEEVSQWFMLITVGHKLVIGFAMVGVINGIFMQETLTCVASDDRIMVRQQNRQRNSLASKMQRLFKLADTDQDGSVSLGEFLAVLEFKEVRTWLCSFGFDSNDIESAFWMLAGDDGHITEEELIEGMEHLRGPARSLDVVNILTRGSVGKNVIQAMNNVKRQSIFMPGSGQPSESGRRSDSLLEARLLELEAMVAACAQQISHAATAVGVACVSTLPAEEAAAGAQSISIPADGARRTPTPTAALVLEAEQTDNASQVTAAAIEACTEGTSTISRV